MFWPDVLLNRGPQPSSIPPDDAPPMLQGLRVTPAAVPPVALRPRATEVAASASTSLAPSFGSLAQWLFSGALAHSSGAIAGWRDRETGKLSDEYPEITGYYLSTAVVSDATASPAVAGAARWLTGRIEANQIASRRADGPAIYNFDEGIIASGLIKYGVRAGDGRALAAGMSAAARLRDQVRRYGYLPTLDSRGGLPVGRPATWSTVGCLHLAKTVQCLLLADEFGASGMRDAAAGIIEHTKAAFSLDSDSLREANGAINLHSACYALEGLWIWSVAQRTSDHDELLGTALGELLAQRLSSGGFPRNLSGPHEQGDVTSQVIRLALLLGRGSAVQSSIARLREIAIPTERGHAMPYQPEAVTSHQNAWVTMFASQSLALADGLPDLEWWELI
jgi:hypothetical protein